MRAAVLTLVGILLSGPLALLLVELVSPQPAWQGVEVFLAHYHPIQAAPFFAGFLLVGSYAALVAALHVLAPPRLRARTTTALLFTAAFVAVVVGNYIHQTTFVPALVQTHEPGNGVLLSAFAMTNPFSLAWSLEMWGYALLGVATWLVAPVFAGSRLERTTAGFFVANGIVSIAGGIWTAVAPGWVMTTPGLVAFALWNGLVFTMSALAVAALRRRTLGHAPRPAERTTTSSPPVRRIGEPAIS